MFKRGELLVKGFDFFGDFLWFSPKESETRVLWKGRNYTEACMILIKGAKEKIDIAMYQIKYQYKNNLDPVGLILAELIKAKERGVQVRVLLNGYFSDIRQTRAQEEVVRFLQGKGIEVRYCEKNKVVHAKVIMVDDGRMLGGSANWTRRGLTKNIELNMLLDDSGFVGKAGAEFERMFARGR